MIAGARPVAAVALFGALVGLWISPGRAYAEQLEPADTRVAHPRVTYLEHTAPGRVFVELNNGAAYGLRACRQEDSRGCYWDARTRGNGRGHSFVVVHVGELGACLLFIAPRYARAHNECGVTR